MADTKNQARWRAEFVKFGEASVRDHLDSFVDEPKRQFTFRWLAEQERARTFYTRWTFWVAVSTLVSTLILGIIGILVTLLH